MKRHPTSVQHIIGSDAHLQRLLSRAGDFQLLTEQVQKLLPSGLSAHLSTAVGRNGLLVLFTDSPAWATRLRYAAPGLQAALGSFHDVQIRVAPLAGTPLSSKKSANRKARLSRQAAQQIRIMAETISDPQLRASLNRLAALSDEQEY